MGKPKTFSHSSRKTRGAPQLPADALLGGPAPRTKGSYELIPKNDAQRHAISTVHAHQITFIDGPAGTGKTHIMASMAALALHNKQVDKVIVTRPNVEVGVGLGFLKGTLEEKIAPYFSPVRRIFEKVLGPAFVEYAVQGENPKIEIAPVPFLRGHTFENAFVLLDEAQNMTPKEMELFLSRFDDHSKGIVDGDAERQLDIEGPSGLPDAIARLRHSRFVGHFTFTEDDIVRGGFCRDVVQAYRKPIPANDDQFSPPDFLRASGSVVPG